MQRRDVGDHASVGGHRRRARCRSDRRPAPRATAPSDEREERAVARAADRLALEPAVAERALLVRAPASRRHVAVAAAGDHEREPLPVASRSSPSPRSAGPRSTASCVPAHVKVLRRPELPAVEHGRPVGIRAEVRQPLEEPLHRDPHLHAREVVAGAEVRAEPERGVVALRAEEVVRVGGRAPRPPRPDWPRRRARRDSRRPGSVTPPSSVSTSARRVWVPIGETQRSPSSIASRTSPAGSAASAAA